MILIDPLSPSDASYLKKLENWDRMYFRTSHRNPNVTREQFLVVRGILRKAGEMRPFWVTERDYYITT